MIYVSVILVIVGLNALHRKSWEGWKPGPNFNPECVMCEWGLDYGFDNGCKHCAEHKDAA